MPAVKEVLIIPRKALSLPAELIVDDKHLGDIKGKFFSLLNQLTLLGVMVVCDWSVPLIKDSSVFSEVSGSGERFHFSPNLMACAFEFPFGSSESSLNTAVLDYQRQLKSASDLPKNHTLLTGSMVDSRDMTALQVVLEEKCEELKRARHSDTLRELKPHRGPASIPQVRKRHPRKPRSGSGGSGGSGADSVATMTTTSTVASSRHSGSSTPESHTGAPTSMASIVAAVSRQLELNAEEDGTAAASSTAPTTSAHVVSPRIPVCSVPRQTSRSVQDLTVAQIETRLRYVKDRIKYYEGQQSGVVARQMCFRAQQFKLEGEILLAELLRREALSQPKPEDCRHEKQTEATVEGLIIPYVYVRLDYVKSMLNYYSRLLGPGRVKDESVRQACEEFKIEKKLLEGRIRQQCESAHGVRFARGPLPVIPEEERGSRVQRMRAKVPSVSSTAASLRRERRRVRESAEATAWAVVVEQQAQRAAAERAEEAVRSGQQESLGQACGELKKDFPDAGNWRKNLSHHPNEYDAQLVLRVHEYLGTRPDGYNADRHYELLYCIYILKFLSERGTALNRALELVQFGTKPSSIPRALDVQGARSKMYSILKAAKYVGRKSVIPKTQLSFLRRNWVGAVIGFALFAAAAVTVTVFTAGLGLIAVGAATAVTVKAAAVAGVVGGVVGAGVGASIQEAGRACFFGPKVDDPLKDRPVSIVNPAMRVPSWS